jgi:ADP-ribose pyrophosphatase YjhB (NUDIX family)
MSAWLQSEQVTPNNACERWLPACMRAGVRAARVGTVASQFCFTEVARVDLSLRSVCTRSSTICTTLATAPAPRVVSLALVRRRHGACGWLCRAPWQVLMLRRVTHHWHLHGGQIELGESDEEALVRETEEEVGGSVAARDLAHVADLVVDGRLVRLYAARRWMGTPAHGGGHACEVGACGRAGQRAARAS